jgi:hypothetical protein
MSTIDLFLDELKSEYDKEFELKSSLENKANYLNRCWSHNVTIIQFWSCASRQIKC